MAIALPKCKNPQHPDGVTRDSMICLEEREDCFVFACKTCKDRLGVVAAQVKMKAAVRAQSRKELAARNALLQAPPPRVKRAKMDQSLRQKAVDHYGEAEFYNQSVMKTTKKYVQ